MPNERFGLKRRPLGFRVFIVIWFLLATHDWAELLDGEERQLALQEIVGFDRAAHTRLFGLLNTQNRALRAPSALLYFAAPLLKILKF